MDRLAVRRRPVPVSVGPPRLAVRRAPFAAPGQRDLRSRAPVGSGVGHREPARTVSEVDVTTLTPPNHPRPPYARFSRNHPERADTFDWCR